MHLSKHLFTSAIVAIFATASSNAAVILSDNFTTEGNPNTMDLNYNLAIRRVGSVTTQTWVNTGGNAQVGNTGTNAGQPGAPTNGNYMLFAGGSTSNALVLTGTLTSVPLSISFDAYRRQTDAADSWVSFALSTSSTYNGQPANATAAFSFLFRGNTGIQIFSGTTPLATIASTSGGSNFQFLFTNTATGTDITVTNGAATVGTYSVASLFTADKYMSFRSENGAIYGGIDNLLVQTVPEPTTALLGAVAALGLLRRRRN